MFVQIARNHPIYRKHIGSQPSHKKLQHSTIVTHFNSVVFQHIYDDI